MLRRTFGQAVKSKEMIAGCPLAGVHVHKHGFPDGCSGGLPFVSISALSCLDASGLLPLPVVTLCDFCRVRGGDDLL